MFYPARQPLAQTPTPLQPLRRLQQQTGGPLIWVKRDDLTGSALSGNKVRKLEFIAGHALQHGYTALITCGGTQSNHCRATALVAAQLGLSCQLILRDDSAARVSADQPLEYAGNRLLDSLAGATVSVHPAPEYFSRLDELLAEAAEGFAASGEKALLIPTGGSDAIGVWGYVAAAEELAADIQRHQLGSTAIVTATGSGGTQAGLSAGVALFDIDAAVYGVCVCDNEAWFQKKVAADIAAWRHRYPEVESQLDGREPNIQVLDGYVGEGYGRADESVYEVIRMLAANEGIVLDPIYTGKAFAGLLAEIRAGRFNKLQNIVFVHTGGLFGLFPYAHSLLQSGSAGIRTQ